MQRFVDDRVALSHFQAPVFVHQANPHEYLYVACFDGTGNDKNKDGVHETNVGKISDQIFQRFEAGQHRIAQGYVAGPGTEDGWLRRTTDGMLGYTYDSRLEKMYGMFIKQAKTWIDADPSAQIRVAETGFSRGGEQAAGLARLIEERGIQNPIGAIYTRSAHGQITHVEYTRPPLVPPHQVAQAVALFDPVGTGAPVREYDRRLPPTVISGIQLISTEERRDLFKSDHIIDPGATDDGRFLGLYVPGAHSDVGGWYLADGLSTRSGNLMIDYFNSLSDTPFLHPLAMPDNPALNVVHRSEDGSLLYWLAPKVDRLQPDGYHTLEVATDRDLQTVKGDPYNAEPINQAMNAQFEHRAVPTGPLRVAHAAPAQPDRDLDRCFDQLYQGARLGNGQAMDQAAQNYLQSTRGQAWQQQVQDYAQVLQAQACAQEQAMQQPLHTARQHTL